MPTAGPKDLVRVSGVRPRFVPPPLQGRGVIFWRGLSRGSQKSAHPWLISFGSSGAEECRYSRARRNESLANKPSLPVERDRFTWSRLQSPIRLLQAGGRAYNVPPFRTGNS